MHSLRHITRKVYSSSLCERCGVRFVHLVAPQDKTSYRTPTDKTDNKQLFTSIRQVLNTDSSLLKEMSRYHFNGLGKTFRPNVILQAAQALNVNQGHPEGVTFRDQFIVCMISEMIHTASLIHDDIIDNSHMRRGLPSVFYKHGQSAATFAGDYVLAKASITLSKIRHNEVMRTMSTILDNLVQGEFMQLGTKEHSDERFNHYIEKSYKKTASLMANCCKCVAILAGVSEEKINSAFEYGKNLGIAFQLVDDLLDFIANEKLFGKPVAADMKLGLATAPVLFASQQYPELNSLILRRFSNEGDVNQALDIVRKSDGGEMTRELAHRYGVEAIKCLDFLESSRHKSRLIEIVKTQLQRTS